MTGGERLIGWIAAALAGAALAGCGGDQGGDAGGGPDPAAISVAQAEPSGDGQIGTAGTALPQPLRIVVRRGSGPEAGAVVNWSTPGTGASVTPPVDTTGSDGISTGVWRLGDEAGTQSAQAEVVGGAEGSPLHFTATATAPGGDPGEVRINLLNSGGNRFEPANVTIPVGTKVTWTWVAGFHDVSSGDFTGSGEPVSPPRSHSFTFESPGTYIYFCSVHGSPTGGMRGTIVVR